MAWDSLDYGALVAASTDVVVARCTVDGASKFGCTEHLRAVKRLKDSSAPRAASRERPLYSNSFNIAERGPYNKGFILFLKARPTSIGWVPPVGWPARTILSADQLSDYARITFDYMPAVTKNMVVPYTPERERKILAAVAAQGQKSHPFTDWLLHSYSLELQYFGKYNGYIAIDRAAKLQKAKAIFLCAQKVLTKPTDGNDLDKFSTRFECQLRINGLDAQAKIQSERMTALQRQANKIPYSPMRIEREDWFDLYE